MKLEHPDLPLFEPFLREVHQIAFTTGLKAIESKGYKFEDLEQNETCKKVFIRGCHYGYDKAQQRIGVKVIALEESIKAEENQLKELRRTRNKQIRGMIERIRVLKDRQLTLRRIIDTIVYSIIMPDEWIIRRLGDDQIRRIDPKVLERALRYATSRNQDTRYNFSVVSDLSTAIHIGDIFEVIRPPNKNKSWRILELKGGKVNAILSEILGDKAAPLNEEERNSLEQTLGKHAVKQAQRMLKQRDNLSQLEKIVETDRGIDFGTKREIILSPDVAIVEDYEKDLATLIEDASSKKWASTTIDGCLHLVAMRDDLYRDRGRQALIPAFHLFAHIDSPDSYLKPSSDQEIREELLAFAKKAPIIDLVNLNMRMPRGRPIFCWLAIPPTRQVELAMGHIRLFAYFDIEAFLKHVVAAGIKVSWITGKEADGLKNISQRIPGSPNAYGVRVELPGGSEQQLMVGFFSRVFLYLTKPSSLLMMIKRWDEQNDKIAKTHFPEDSQAKQ